MIERCKVFIVSFLGTGVEPQCGGSHNARPYLRFVQNHFKICQIQENSKRSHTATFSRLLGTQWLKGARFLLFLYLVLVLYFSAVVVSMSNSLCTLCRSVSNSVKFHKIHKHGIFDGCYGNNVWLKNQFDCLFRLS